MCAYITGANKVKKWVCVANAYLCSNGCLKRPLQCEIQE
jgi:hypothetical protein